MLDPKESHDAGLKHVLRYLCGTLSYRLTYRLNVDIDDVRIIPGYIFYFGESPITWSSQKQKSVALLCCKAELMAATEATKQAMGLQELLSEVTGVECERVIIRVDNKSAISLTKKPVFHGRSKHIHKRYHFI